MEAGTELKRGQIVSLKDFRGDVALAVVVERKLGFFFRAVATKLEDTLQNRLLLTNAYNTFDKTFVLTSSWFDIKNVVEAYGEVR